jgi:predicted nucleic acid-binding protein
MPDLLVRGVAASVIKALKERAGAHGRSSEAEHRQRTREGAYLSVITVGALRRGIERIRLRGDAEQATLLADWLTIVLDQHAGNVPAFDADAVQIWGRPRVRDPGHARDKQIAAIAPRRVQHHSTFRNSSRSRPLKLSFVPFCHGFPGSICTVSTLFSASHFRIARLTNSGPLSLRMKAGMPPPSARTCRSAAPACAVQERGSTTGWPCAVACAARSQASIRSASSASPTTALRAASVSSAASQRS